MIYISNVVVMMMYVSAQLNSVAVYRKHNRRLPWHLSNQDFPFQTSVQDAVSCDARESQWKSHSTTRHLSTHPGWGATTLDAHPSSLLARNCREAKENKFEGNCKSLVGGWCWVHS